MDKAQIKKLMEDEIESLIRYKKESSAYLDAKDYISLSVQIESVLRTYWDYFLYKN